MDFKAIYTFPDPQSTNTSVLSWGYCLFLLTKPLLIENGLGDLCAPMWQLCSAGRLSNVSYRSTYTLCCIQAKQLYSACSQHTLLTLQTLHIEIFIFPLLWPKSFLSIVRPNSTSHLEFDCTSLPMDSSEQHFDSSLCVTMSQLNIYFLDEKLEMKNKVLYVTTNI